MKLDYLWSVSSLSVLQVWFPRENERIIVLLTRRGWGVLKSAHTLVPISSHTNLFLTHVLDLNPIHVSREKLTAGILR